MICLADYKIPLLKDNDIYLANNENLLNIRLIVEKRQYINKEDGLKLIHSNFAKFI
jgi:hypothetical protein